MKKTLIGIVLFLMQISLAIYYSGTIDLYVIAAVSVVTFGYILYKYINKSYDSCEL